MARITFKDLAQRGLFLTKDITKVPAGFLRRFRGIAAYAFDSIISRDGGSLIRSSAAISIVRFASAWYTMATTTLVDAGGTVKSGLSGDRLSFTIMPPTAGKPDQLFVAGGGELFKVDSDGTATAWGIEQFPSYPTLADSADGGGSPAAGTYKYRFTFYNSTSGSRGNPMGDPDTDLRLVCHLDNNVTDTLGRHTPTNEGTFTYSSGTKKFGTHSAVLNGTDQYLSVPDSSDFAFGGSDFTIHCWVRFDSVSKNQGLFSIYEDSSNYLRVSYNQTLGTIEASALSGGYNVFTAISESWSPSTNTWYHICVMGAGPYFRLCIDGDLIKQQTRLRDFPDYGGPLYFGRSRWTSDVYLDGYLDECVVAADNIFFLGGSSFSVPTAPTDTTDSVTTSGANSISISNIPESFDSQVDYVEVWRTIASGTSYYKAGQVANGTSTFSDEVADADLGSTELPTDNHVPYAYFDDCFGPFNGSMFWLTRSEDGEKGRLYYSAIGRAEAMQGFIEVTSNEDGLQKIVSFAGNLFVLSRSKAFQIYGNNPYQSREIAGVPGTNQPHTVVVTPFGPMWQAADGIRLFPGGGQSQLVSDDALTPITRAGFTLVGDLSAFEGVVATFARGEYIISTTTQTLAYNIEKRRWRNVSIAATAFAYDAANDVIAAGFGSTVIELEDFGDTQDNATSISFGIEFGNAKFDPPAILERLRIDADANGETLTPAIYLDGSLVVQSNLTSTAGRRITEYDLGSVLVSNFYIRIYGTLDDQIEIYDSCTLDFSTLHLSIWCDGQEILVPGRIDTARSTITFQLDSDEQSPLDHIYLFERFSYDLNPQGEDVVPKLYLATNGTSTFTLNTISDASRVIGEDPITKAHGRFSKFTLEGDFSVANALAFYKFELTCTKRGK